MKAKKKRGSTTGKSSRKRPVKDLPARKSENVRGGWISNRRVDVALKTSGSTE